MTSESLPNSGQSIKHLVDKEGEFQVQAYSFLKTKAEIIFIVRGIHVLV